MFNYFNKKLRSSLHIILSIILKIIHFFYIYHFLFLLLKEIQKTRDLDNLSKIRRQCYCIDNV